MKFKKSQSGRSMVEMLGVLAIIGVLSVGGIAGYSLSMRRHRANGIIDTFSKFAVTAYGLCQQKVLNGELSELNFCGINNTNFSFENAGIGNLPASVTELQSWVVWEGGETGVDTVALQIYLNDTKLCKAAASIAGGSCGKNGTSDWLSIEFKQN